MTARRPSAATVLSIVALVFALAGTGVASVATISALSKKEKKQTRRIADNEVNRLAPGLSVKAASSAGTAQSAATAGDSGRLGGRTPEQFGAGLMTGQITGLATGSQSGAPTGVSAAGVSSVVEGLWPQEPLQVSDFSVSLRGTANVPGGSSQTMTLWAAGAPTLSCTINAGENGCTAPGPISVPVQPSLAFSTTFLLSTITGTPGASGILFSYRVSPDNG